MLSNILAQLQELTEPVLINGIASAMILSALPTFFTLVFFKRAPYGRYANEGQSFGFMMNGKLAWVLQEIPCVVFAGINLYIADPACLKSIPNMVLFGLFSLHYAHR